MQAPLSTKARVVLLAGWTIAVQLGGIAATMADEGGPVDRSVEAPPVPPEPASTAPAPTEPTTTVPPVPTSAARTVPPAPGVVVTRAAVPATPAPPPARPAPTLSPEQRVRAAFDASVPASWQAAIPVRFEIIRGSTSWAHSDGLIQIGTYHVNNSSAKLRATVAHEFGHLIAFRYGSNAYDGAAPRGWPAYGSNPAEAWADCVSQAFTGVVDPSHGLPPCQGESLSWTRAWLAGGPPGAA